MPGVRPPHQARPCPSCAETVDATASRCPHCGENLATAPSPVQPAFVVQPTQVRASNVGTISSDLNREVLLDFVLFRRLLTPVMIVGGFWIASAYWVWDTMGPIFTSTDMPFKWAMRQLVVTLVGIVSNRVVCEFLVVVFRISETLVDIKGELGTRSRG